MFIALYMGMKRRVIIPEYRNRISPLFDVAKTFSVFIIDGGAVCESYYLNTTGFSGRAIVECLCREAPDVVICSAISRCHAGMLTSGGIELISGVIGEIGDVVRAYINDELESDLFAMPGCRRRGGGGRGHGGMGRGGGQCRNRGEW